MPANYYSQQIELGGRKQQSDARKLGNQNANADEILVVPSKAQGYRKALYFFNFILGGLGLTLLSMAVVMYVRPDDVLMPGWLVWYFGVIGIFQLMFGAIASRGAVVAKRSIETGLYNYYLFGFLIFMTTLLIVEIVMICVVVVKESGWNQENVNDGSDFLTEYIEDSLKNEFESREAFWWEIQKSWKCCGWDNNTIPDSLATGKFCTTDMSTSAPACKDDMTEYVKDNSLFMIIFGSVFLLSQMFVWYSACQLGCCISAMKPVYAER